MVVLHYPWPGAGASGIARYSRELATALRASSEPVLEWGHRNLELRLGRVRVGGLVTQRLQMLWRPPRRHGLLHSTHVYSAHRQADVVTVQDCFPEVYREELGRTALEERLWRKSLARMVARRCRFITATEAVKQAFLGLHPEVDADRIHTTPYGIDERFQPAPGKVARHPAYREGSFNVLCVADLNPRKRFDWLLEAALASDPSIHVVHAGSQRIHRPAWEVQAERERPLADALGPRLVRLGGVPDADLVRLYQGADLLVLPSLDEGFGFPPLEALACGTPVLAYAAPVLREVLGAKASYFDGPDSLPAALEACRKRGVPTARQRASRHAWVRSTYTWERTARMTQAVYRLAEEDRSRRPSASARVPSSR